MKLACSHTTERSVVRYEVDCWTTVARNTFQVVGLVHSLFQARTGCRSNGYGETECVCRTATPPGPLMPYKWSSFVQAIQYHCQSAHKRPLASRWERKWPPYSVSVFTAALCFFPSVSGHSLSSIPIPTNLHCCGGPFSTTPYATNTPEPFDLRMAQPNAPFRAELALVLWVGPPFRSIPSARASVSRTATLL